MLCSHSTPSAGSLWLCCHPSTGWGGPKSGHCAHSTSSSKSYRPSGCEAFKLSGFVHHHNSVLLLAIRSCCTGDWAEGEDLYNYGSHIIILGISVGGVCGGLTQMCVCCGYCEYVLMCTLNFVVSWLSCYEDRMGPCTQSSIKRT